MYFPYLRGRQFELISLRELCEKKLLHNSIIPIIEPVNLSSTLLSTIKIFKHNDHKMALIVNPSVGFLDSDFKKKPELVSRYQNKIEYDNILPTYHFSKDLFLNESDLSLSLIILNDPDVIRPFKSLAGGNNPKYIVCPDDREFRREIRGNKILLDDSFEKQRRNVDYLEIEDEFFSSDHLYYSEDGYLGFSDYSIVGDFFVESGFAPYAVAIHIVYFDTNKELRIRHFVSDSNDDITDPAGKFYEAVTKLNDWYNTDYNKVYDTFGLNSFIELYESKGYPGLGVVKKFSIMHHLELLSKFFAEQE